MSMRQSQAATATRAIARWALRLFVRERRQQFLVVGVIAIAVAAAIFSVSAVYNVPASPAATFGTAQQRFAIKSADPSEIANRVAAARQDLGTIEVIGHQSVPIPGSSDFFDARAQDPHGVYAQSTLRLRHGRFPGIASEVAITDKVAQTIGVDIGGAINIGTVSLAVVGEVENPYDLSDEFILTPASGDVTSDSVTVLANAADSEMQTFRSSTGQDAVEIRGSNVSRNAAAAMLAASTVVFLLVALVASAGFAVVAQRRLRQLGMLAAIGATDRNLKLVLLVHGAIVGVIASLSGTMFGLAAWFALAPRLETGAGHRIDALNLPWALLIGAIIAGVIVPIAAAWWPTRALPRMSIVDALSSRPPQPRRADTSVVLASFFAVAGVVLAGLSRQSNPLLLILGMTAIVVGILLACPTAIQLLARFARHAPVTVRVALRDLGRYQARAGAALAAISLALGIPIAIVLVASAADSTAAEAAGNGNLANTQLLIRINQSSDASGSSTPGVRSAEQPNAPLLTAAQLAALQGSIDNVAAALDHAITVPLEMAMDPSTPADSRPLIDLAEPIVGDAHRFRAVSLFVATSQLLQYLDIATIASDAEVLTTNDGSPLLPLKTQAATPKNQVIAAPQYSSFPKAFITQLGLDTYGLQSTLVGWIVESARPLTDAQITGARHVAVGSGFTIEARHGPTTRGAIRNIATAAGAVFALAIVAMTVGTIRSEAASELRTLTATGASSSIRRSLTATTAASLAVAGVILGTVGAYLGLMGAYVHHLGRLGDVPLGNLAAALVGVPLLSGLVGWCLGGREPLNFARQAAD